MEGERKGNNDRDDTKEREKAERKKWGHDGTSDVYEDLENLERAIRLENSEFKLKHEILKEKVDFIDQSKREVIPDALRFLIVPLAYAFGLFKMASSNRAILRTMSRSATKVMDLHFWIFVVWSPILLNAMKRVSKPPPNPVPDELATVDMESVPVGYWASSAFDWEDPKEDCNDSVLFLTEYWTSAVNGMVYLQILKWIATMAARRTAGAGIGSIFQSSSLMLWLSCAQALTRIGAVVSLHQYPEKMYDFERSQLTQPVAFFPVLMWKLLRVMMLLAPLGVISDFSKVLLHLPKEAIYPLYGSIAILLYGTWARMQESVSKNKDPLSPTRLKPPKPLAKLAYSLGYFVLWRKQFRMLGLEQKLKEVAGKLFTSFYGVFWKGLGLVCLFPLPLLGPLVHLKAFGKIFEVEYVNDLPPLSTTESYQKTIEETPERADDMAWRYSLRWRPPQRLALSKAVIYNELIYRCLVKGTAIDLLEQLSSRDGFDDESLRRSLKQRPGKDREHWKTRAMEFQAQKHKRNYESGKMDDPLGVAVWRAFGIGLGFNFEHMRELKDGEDPSPRRLQARAAKSALRRYNELYKEEQASIKHNESLGPEERDDAQVETMKQRFDEEIRYLAGRLTELIPTSSKMEEFGFLDVAKFKMKKEPSFRKLSTNEIQMLEEDPLGYNANPSSESGMLLNNIQNRRHDTSRSYRTLLEDDDEAKRSDKKSSVDGSSIEGDGGNQNDNIDDDSTDGLIDVEYV
eukprot:jgi/Psemu1/215397/e_gw1.743.24.1